MAQAEGTLKKIFSWKASLAVVVGVAVVLAITGVAMKVKQDGSRLNIAVQKARVATIEEIYIFPDGVTQIRVPLGSGWSRKIVFPEDAAWFKAVTPPGKKVLVKDWRGKIWNGSSWPWLEVSIANKVICLAGEDTATVTIERR